MSRLWGGLWKIKGDNVDRYRCHTGHVYTEKVLFQVQSEEIEETLWVAIRMLEERRNLLLTVSAYGSNTDSIEERKRRANDINVHIERLKAILLSIDMNEQHD